MSKTNKRVRLVRDEIAEIHQINTDGKKRMGGDRFEELTRVVLRNAPEYNFEKVERFSEWSERERLMGHYSAKDTGIDLVGTLKDSGDCVAIQCKSQDSAVGLKDLGTFLSSSTPIKKTRFSFKLRMLVCTHWPSETVVDKLDNHDGRVINLLEDHGNDVIDKGDFELFVKLTPNIHQQEAILNGVEYFSQQNMSRGHLVMACGTGKTFTTLRLAEELTPKCILFIAPSIALVAQARREWVRQTRYNSMKSMIVCSDSSAGKSNNLNNTDNDHELLFLPCQVSTNANVISSFIGSGSKDAPCVVFCTYQSLHQVALAQKLQKETMGESDKNAYSGFDFCVIDEAHRTTGVERANNEGNNSGDSNGQAKQRVWSYRDIHDNDYITCQKRLYVTATPRIYTKEKSKPSLKIYDMDNEDVYGRRIYHLKFRDAVDAKMLSDYRVIVLFTPLESTSENVKQSVIKMAQNLDVNNPSKRKKKTDYDDFYARIDRYCTRVLGIQLAINGEIIGSSNECPKKMNKLIAFSNTTKVSKFYSNALIDIELSKRVSDMIPYGKEALKINATHLDSTNNALTRARGLTRLDSAKDSECEIVCNVGLFNEGIDVPSLDGVVFLEPRSSQVDVVQSVGRVMRKSQGKERGYIIIPAVVPDTGYDIEKLMEEDKEGFAPVFQTIRALQSHDERLAETPAKFIISATTKEIPGHSSGERTGDHVEEPRDMQLSLDLHNKIRKKWLDDMSERILANIVHKSGLGNQGDITAQRINESVEWAGEVLFNAGMAEKIADAVGATIKVSNKNKQGDKERNTEKKKSELAACKMGALILANACMLNKRLAKDSTLSENLSNLTTVSVVSNPIEHLKKEWKVIIDKDYRPIYDPAMRVLSVLHEEDKGCCDAVRKIAKYADEIAESLNELGYDHAGPLYHTVLDKAEAHGAYYTKNVSALLLANLAMPERWIDWNDVESVNRLRIMDPACGTGSLLMAAMQVIKERVISSKYNDDMDSDLIDKERAGLHRKLVENSLCGLDINLQAIQIAASNLTLGAVDVNYKNMNLFVMRRGVDKNGIPSAGSLELLCGGGLPVINPPKDLTCDDSSHVDNSDAASFPVNGLNMVIMNPPFTSKDKRMEEEDEGGKTVMNKHQNHIKDIVAEKFGVLYRNAINTEGLSTFFTTLAEIILDKDVGTLAAILPMSHCIAPSSEVNRRLISNNFHVELIIAPHGEGKHRAFSASTQSHECMMIARRIDKESICQPTKICSITRIPQNRNEVREFVSSINNKSMSEWGLMIDYPYERIRDGDWSPLQWCDVRLVEAIESIKTNAELVRTGDVYQFGTWCSSVYDVFVPEDNNSERSKSSIPCFNTLSTELRFAIHAQPSEYMNPIKGKEVRAKKMMEKSGNVLIARRVNTSSGLCTAIYSETPCIGRQWTPIITKSENEAKALSVWWNSTIVWLLMLNGRSAQLNYPRFSINQFRDIRTPILAKGDNLKILLDAYEKVCDEKLCVFSKSAMDSTRIIIDEAAAAVAGIDKNLVGEWREWLSLEPVVRRKDDDNEINEKII